MDDQLLDDSNSNGTITTIHPSAYPSGHYDVSEWALAGLLITVIIGIVGNNLVVVAFAKDRRLRVLFNLLVVHLAVVDISIGIVLAFTIVVEFARLSFFFDSRFLCQACAVLANALPAEQLIITHIMCNNRHRALQHGLSYTRHVQHWHTEKLVVFITWVVTLAASFLVTDITLTVHPIEFHSCHFPKRLFYVNYMSFVNCILLLGLLVALLCIIRDFWRLRQKPLPFMRLQDVETNPPDKREPHEEIKGRENSRFSQSLVPRSPIHVFRNVKVNLSSVSTPERTLEFSPTCAGEAKTKLFERKKDASPRPSKSLEKPKTGSAEEGRKKSPKSLVYYSLMATSPSLRDKLSGLISLNLLDSIDEHKERLFGYRGQAPVVCKPLSASRDVKNVPENNLENDTEDNSSTGSVCSADDLNNFIQHGSDRCHENIGLKNNRQGKISLAQAVPMKIKSALGKGKSEIRRNVRILESDKKASGKVSDDAVNNKPDELEGKVINPSLTDDVFTYSSSLSDDELTEFPLPRFRPRTDSLYTLRSRLSISEESVTDPTITDEIKENSVRSDDSASVEESEVCLKSVKGRREDSKLSTIGDDEDDPSIQITEHNVKGKSDSLRTLLSCYGIPGGSNLKSSSESSPASADLPMQNAENGTNSLVDDTSNERTSLVVKAMPSQGITTVSNVMESRTLETSPAVSPESNHREETNVHDNTQSAECDRTLKERLKDSKRYKNEEGEDEFYSQQLKNIHDDNNSSIKIENIDAVQENLSQACQRISELDDGCGVRQSERKSDFRQCQKERRFSNEEVSSINNDNNNALKHIHSRNSVKKKIIKHGDSSQSTSESCSKPDKRSTGSVTVIQTELPATEIEKAVKDWISFYGIQVPPGMKVFHENILQSPKRSRPKRKIKSLIPQKTKKMEPEMYQLRVMHSFTNTNGVSPSARQDLNSIEAQIDDGDDMGHSQRDIDLAVENWIAFYDIRQKLPPGCDYLKTHGDGKVELDNSSLFPPLGVENDSLQRARKIWIDFYGIQSPGSSTQLAMNSKKERMMSVFGDELAPGDGSLPGETEKSLHLTDKSQVMPTALMFSHSEGLNVTGAILTNVDETGETEKRKQKISARVKGTFHQTPLSKCVSSHEDKYITHSPGEGCREESEGGRAILSRVCKPLMFNQSFSFLSGSDALVHTTTHPLRSISESQIKTGIKTTQLVEQPLPDCGPAGPFISFANDKPIEPNVANDKPIEPNVKIASESVREKGDCLVTLKTLCNGKVSDIPYSKTVAEVNVDACNILQCNSEKNICNTPWAKSQYAKLNNNSFPDEIVGGEITDESFKIKVPKPQTVNGDSIWKNLTHEFTKEHSTADNGKNVKTKVIPYFTDMSLQNKTGMEAVASMCPVNGKGFNHLRISPKEMLESLSISRRAFLVEVGIYGDIEKGLIPLDKELLRFKAENDDESGCPYCAQRMLDENKKMGSRDNHVFDEGILGLEKMDGDKENSTNNSQQKMKPIERDQTAQFSLSNNSSGAWLKEGQPSHRVDLEMTSLGGSDSILSFMELRPQNPGTNCLCVSKMNCEMGTFERLKISHPELTILISLALIIFGQLICWLPITVLYMYYEITGFPSTPTNQELAFITLWCARMALQPMVYAFYSKYFRESFAQLLSCRFSR